LVDIENWLRHIPRDSDALGMTEADRLAALNPIEREQYDLDKAIEEHDEQRREPGGPTREEEDAFAEAHDADESAEDIHRANEDYYDQWEVDSDGNHYAREWDPDDRMDYRDFEDGISVSSSQDNRDAKDALDREDYQDQQDRDATAAEHRERQERDRGAPSLEEEQAFAEAHQSAPRETRNGGKRPADIDQSDGDRQPKKTRLLGRSATPREPSQNIAEADALARASGSDAGYTGNTDRSSPDQSGQKSPRHFDRPPRSDHGIGR